MTKTPVLCSLMISYLKGHLFTVSKQCHNQPATILFEFLTWGDVNMFEIPFQALPERLEKLQLMKGHAIYRRSSYASSLPNDFNRTVNLLQNHWADFKYTWLKGASYFETVSI